jgi:hypothetical protein
MMAFSILSIYPSYCQSFKQEQSFIAILLFSLLWRVGQVQYSSFAIYTAALNVITVMYEV